MKNIKYELRSTWKELLIIPEKRPTNGTYTTKVIKKPYGFIVNQFNNFVTLYKHKVVLLDGGFVKMFTTMNKNYTPIQRWVTYYNNEGKEIWVETDHKKEITVFNRLIKNLGNIELCSN